MGHPEALNQSSLTVNSTQAEHTKSNVDRNGHDLPRVIDLSSRGLCVFPALDSQSCLRSLTCLYLNYNKLTVVPCSLQKVVPNLQVLNLNDNEIVEIPEDVGSLSFLQELYICKNKLISLPPSLCKLKLLRILKASDNKLNALYSELGQNESLEELNVSGNNLKRFPATLGLLKNICILEASNNELDYIPKTIHFLECLQVLNLSSNLLVNIPDSFSLLENLHHIDLSENKLSSLWPCCASIHCLEKIILDSNLITMLPHWFSQLGNIREISVAGNNLKHHNSLPTDFGTSLQRLTKLDLRGNFIEKLPPTFRCLSGLQTLLLGPRYEKSTRIDSFQNGNWLTSIPENFADLKNLVILAVEENQLTLLPKNFGCLISLKELCLAGNLLTSLPKSFSQLESLEKCQLSNNKLRSLPEDFGQLDRLTELYLDNNKLKTLPLSVKNCARLEVLDLRRNRFIETPCSILDACTKLKDLRLVKNCPHNDGCGDGISSDLEDYSDGDEDDGDIDRDCKSTSSGSSTNDKALVKAEEENWDEDLNVQNTPIVSSESKSEIEPGQFDLDCEECHINLKNKESALTFDFYGNASQRIDLSISQHRMLPYLLHQPKQMRWQREAGHGEEDQFSDAVIDGTNTL